MQVSPESDQFSSYGYYLYYPPKDYLDAAD
ncbi:UNVERIFIED_ORG: hypothetical protein J2W82_003509 [Pseudomonas mohnii]|jgi:hypothetical protein|nr:hypothetical protein [Pseudomonas mohnii]